MAQRIMKNSKGKDEELNSLHHLSRYWIYELFPWEQLAEILRGVPRLNVYDLNIFISFSFIIKQYLSEH